MHLIFSLLTVLLLVLPVSARSEVLVELFTSQGCSSCPPADALLAELGEQSGVITLAYHVDYWDYLGWRDTFASPENTARQRAYAGRVDRQWLRRPLRGSFTPEVVIGGTDSLVGSSSQKVAMRIIDHMQRAVSIGLVLSRDGDDLTIRVLPGHTPRDVEIKVARFIPEQTVAVGRGENGGRTITYSHIVTSLETVGTWDGFDVKTLEVPDMSGPLAVFLQEGEAGPVWAAESLE